jgi:hypothetical protein
VPVCVVDAMLQSNFYAAGMTAALDEFHTEWLRVTTNMMRRDFVTDGYDENSVRTMTTFVANLEMTVAQSAGIVNHTCDPHDRTIMGLPPRSMWNWLALPVPHWHSQSNHVLKSLKSENRSGWTDRTSDDSESEVEGVEVGGVVFGDLNFNNKIEPVMFSVWMSILSRVPGSVLLLHLPTPHHQAANVLPTHLAAEAAARGIHPSRIVFAPR